MLRSRFSRSRVVTVAALATTGVALSSGLLAAKEPPEDHGHPPHAARLTAVSDQQANPYAVNPAWEYAKAHMQRYFDALYWNDVAAWSRAWEADQARLAAAAAARDAAVVPRPPRSSAPSHSTPVSGACTGGPIPSSQMMNESGGDPNAVGPTQPDGSRPIGCWQTLDSHYRPDGTCAGLSSSNVDGQRECANRIHESQGPGAWTAPIE